MSSTKLDQDVNPHFPETANMHLRRRLEFESRKTVISLNGSALTGEYWHVAERMGPSSLRYGRGSMRSASESGDATIRPWPLVTNRRRPSIEGQSSVHDGCLLCESIKLARKKEDDLTSRFANLWKRIPSTTRVVIQSTMKSAASPTTSYVWHRISPSKIEYIVLAKVGTRESLPLTQATPSPSPARRSQPLFMSGPNPDVNLSAQLLLQDSTISTQYFLKQDEYFPAPGH
ncbi:hypothetical protein F5146DRAFT_994312 [Armillaria mellea]|nr:hypothetical protein F5146DRAFT_994312 [Armillaria mellea]